MSDQITGNYNDNDVEKIMEHLSDNKLVEVVKDNNCLIPIARKIVEHRYVREFLHLSNEMDPDNPQTIELLNLFGNNIKYAKLVYHGKYRRLDQTIGKAISKNCAK